MPDRTPIQLPPGVFRTGSEAEMAGKWYDTQLVRWIGGVLRPVAGWEKILPNDPFNVDAPFATPVRALHTWVSLDGQKHTAIICEQNIYVMDQGGTVQDITPSDGMIGPGETTAGGYGDDAYSFDAYGTPRPDKPADLNKQLSPMYSADNWGDELLVMTSSDTRLLKWSPNDPPGTLAAEVVATPTTGGTVPRGRFFVITPERHCIVFHDGDIFNRFEWCSQEDIYDWNYSSTTNSSGFYEMQPAQPFVTAVITRYAILAFTVNGAYVITYVGTPYFYTYNFLGYYNAPITGNAIAQVSAGTIWLSDDGFWQFDGTTIAPLDCPLLDWIQRTADPVYRYKRTTAFYLGVQSEVWFFFPENGQTENGRYLNFNFDEKWWSKGRLTRTCGAPGSAISYPLMSDGQNVFRHEKGLFYADAPELPFAQTGAINVANGTRNATIRQGIADTRAPAGDVVFWVGSRKNRITDGTNIPDVQLNRAIRRDGGKVDFRVTGRDLILKIQSAKQGVAPWTFGQMLVKVIPRGGR